MKIGLIWTLETLREYLCYLLYVEATEGETGAVELDGIEVKCSINF